MDNFLIAGAGPVGLAAALFLKNDGATARIVDPLRERSRQSRALVVNPRTLTLLEETGVTAKMLERGLKITGFTAWQSAERKMIDVTFEKLSLDHGFVKYPHLLALSQSTTERLLTEALEERGVKIQRGWAVGDVTQADSVDVALGDGTAHENVRVEALVAADGAHSVIRKKLGLSFDGTALGLDWNLADLPLDTDLDPHHAHLCFFDDGGFLFMARVVEDARKEPLNGALWRVMSTKAIDFENLFRSKAAGPVVWQSSFHVSHRIANQLQDRNIFLMGDAAHVHSPAGARGMNLGIEDAWVLSKLRGEGRLSEYGQRRHDIDADVVHKVEFITKVAAGQSDPLIWARAHILPMLLHIPTVKSLMFKTMSGQDHSV